MLRSGKDFAPGRPGRAYFQRRGGGGRPYSPHQAAAGLRGDRLHHPRQGRVHEPRPVRQGPGRVVHPAGCHAARHPAPRRHGRGGHGRQHRHRPDRDRQRARLPHRDRHPRDAEPGEEGRPAPARRRADRGAGRALQEPQPVRALLAAAGRDARPRREPNGAIWANQWDNTANRQAHIETTARRDLGRYRRQGRRLRVGGRLGRHAGRLLGRPQGQAQGHPDRAGRRAGRRALQLLHDRRAQVRGLLHHRRHRPGPRHQEHRRRRGRPRLPDPGRGIRPDLLPAPARGRAVHGRLDRRQRRRRHPARQGDGAGPHHRHPALRLRHALPVQAVQSGVPAIEEPAGARWLDKPRAELPKMFVDPDKA